MASAHGLLRSVCLSRGRRRLRVTTSTLQQQRRSWRSRPRRRTIRFLVGPATYRQYQCTWTLSAL